MVYVERVFDKYTHLSNRFAMAGIKGYSTHFRLFLACAASRGADPREMSSSRESRAKVAKIGCQNITSPRRCCYRRLTFARLHDLRPLEFFLIRFKNNARLSRHRLFHSTSLCFLNFTKHENCNLEELHSRRIIFRPTSRLRIFKWTIVRLIHEKFMQIYC